MARRPIGGKLGTAHRIDALKVLERKLKSVRARQQVIKEKISALNVLQTAHFKPIKSVLDELKVEIRNLELSLPLEADNLDEAKEAELSDKRRVFTKKLAEMDAHKKKYAALMKPLETELKFREEEEKAIDLILPQVAKLKCFLREDMPTIKDIVEALSGDLTPALSLVVGTITRVFLDLSEEMEKTYGERSNKFWANEQYRRFMALKEAGFSDDQAMRILVVNASPPTNPFLQIVENISASLRHKK